MAIAKLAEHLRCKDPDPTKKYDTINVLDPCCGKGAAIKQLSGLIGVTDNHIHTVELDPDRGKDVKELIPEGHHISPATFLGCQITGYSFGLAYVNPPFDSELGGGRREEHAFCQRATQLLVTKGVLVLVCPLKALAGQGMFCDFLMTHYEDCAVYKFPDGEDEDGFRIRPYNEIVFIGTKRKDAVPTDLEHGILYDMEMRYGSHFSMENLPPLGELQPMKWTRGAPSYMREPEVRVWEIPHSWRPNTFKKTSFTDDELREALEQSPLAKLFSDVTADPVYVSPLALDRGHLGLTLASGVLDGVVNGPHGPHVVRGSSSKKQYRDEESTESTVNPDTGAVTTTEIFRERMITTIRCVVDWPTPEIHTFSNDTKEEKSEHVEGDNEEDE